MMKDSLCSDYDELVDPTTNGIDEAETLPTPPDNSTHPEEAGGETEPTPGTGTRRVNRSFRGSRKLTTVPADETDGETAATPAVDTKAPYGGPLEGLLYRSNSRNRALMMPTTPSSTKSYDHLVPEPHDPADLVASAYADDSEQHTARKRPVGKQHV